MASSYSSSLFFHVKLLYLFLCLAYIGLSVNFLLFYRLNKCHDLQTSQSCDLKSSTRDIGNLDRVLRSKRSHDEFETATENSSFLPSKHEHASESQQVNHHRSHSHHNHRHSDHRTGGKRMSRNAADQTAPVVEFFPKPQPTEQSPGHVWLTSYSRIPLPALQEYCFSSREYCPAGQPGVKGDKGEEGSTGPRGPVGPRGPAGPQGLPGIMGSKGETGEPGLDGREGLPGEPGLDGVSGRDGIDGEPGIDGSPGAPGKDGVSGVNGTDGVPGLRGPPGPQGIAGLPGPRGRKGAAGKSGLPGVPGITAWVVNGSETSKLMIPPRMNDKSLQSSLIVQEGDNVRLPCIAEGIPPPKYSWKRTDNRAIKVGHWSNSAVEGSVLNITRVRRDHFGTYICYANNGVPPPASHEISLEITFAPTIRVRQQMLGTNNGSSVLLECFVEAYPPALHYWIHGESRMIENNWKYKMLHEDTGLFSSRSALNVSYVEAVDYSMFKCVAKNSRGKTHALLTVYEIDPHRPKNVSPASYGSSQEDEYVVFGQASLSPVEPCPACADCPVLPRCPKGYNLYDAVRAIPVVGAHHNRSQWVPFQQRKKHSLLYQIGKPVFYRDSDTEWGSWMQDSAPKTQDDESKFWMTSEHDANSLMEFADKDAFRHKNVSRTYQLPFRFDGNSHVVREGHFYYNQFGTNKIIRYDMATNHTYFRVIEDAAYQPSSSRLYETHYNYMDILADENGLWVIFASNTTNNTLIVKFDPQTLGTENAWNLTLDHQMIGEMFIACGILYGIESSTDTFTKIRFAFDLYLNTPVDVSVNFSNPFKHNNLISYNPRYEKIYAWDSRNLIEYPIRFMESTAEETVDESDDASSSRRSSY